MSSPGQLVAFANLGAPSSPEGNDGSTDGLLPQKPASAPTKSAASQETPWLGLSPSLFCDSAEVATQNGSDLTSVEANRLQRTGDVGKVSYMESVRWAVVSRTRRPIPIVHAFHHGTFGVCVGALFCFWVVVETYPYMLYTDKFRDICDVLWWSWWKKDPTSSLGFPLTSRSAYPDATSFCPSTVADRQSCALTSSYVLGLSRSNVYLRSWWFRIRLV